MSVCNQTPPVRLLSVLAQRVLQLISVPISSLQHFKGDEKHPADTAQHISSTEEARAESCWNIIHPVLILECRPSLMGNIRYCQLLSFICDSYFLRHK